MSRNLAPSPVGSRHQNFLLGVRLVRIWCNEPHKRVERSPFVSATESLVLDARMNLGAGSLRCKKAIFTSFRCWGL